jgi:hypothetical protein
MRLHRSPRHSSLRSSRCDILFHEGIKISQETRRTESPVFSLPLASECSFGDHSIPLEDRDGLGKWERFRSTALTGDRCRKKQ